MTDKTTEALDLAEEALQTALDGMGGSYGIWSKKCKPALAAIREALVEPVKQEPAAEYLGFSANLNHVFKLDADIPVGTKLYTAPVSAEREWADLTDDEMWDVFISKDWTGEPLQLMSAVIAAFKEKNT